MSVEAIETALAGGSAVFFADYGRGATRAGFYSNGGCGMVDLFSLVLENQSLFPNTPDALLKNIEESVIYQRTGPYRSNSYDISAYYPYSMDEDQYEVFNSGAASPAMSYMYEFLFSGGLSSEAIEYLGEYDNFKESTLEDDYEFTDVSEYGLEDHPVYIIEDGFPIMIG